VSLKVDDQNQFDMELSPDSILVYSDGERLFVKDLFQSWDDYPSKASPKLPGKPMDESYGDSIGKSLVIHENRVAAIWGENGYYVGVPNLLVGFFSLDDARPVDFVPDAPSDVIPAKPGKYDYMELRTVANRLYIIGGTDRIACYDLDRLEKHWVPPPRLFTNNTSVRNLIVGRDHLLLLMGPTPPQGSNDAGPGDTLSSVKIYTFGRYRSGPDSHAENGRPDYAPQSYPSCVINDLAGITGIEGVDGGICYLTGNGKLHLLRGAGP
jgi:hypothetical protein